LTAVAPPPRTPSSSERVRRPAEEEIDVFGDRHGFLPGSAYLRSAFTHRSAANGDVRQSNERLEFLGDALLSAFVARFLIATLSPETDEGTLSRARVAIIRRETLAAAARSLGVADLLIVGNGERRAGRHTHDGLLADAFEAIIGALYLEAGEASLEQFLRRSLAEPLAQVAADPPQPDPKTALQMLLQATGSGLPAYRLIAEDGGGHDHTFHIAVSAADGTRLGHGAGPNKRAAETAAARMALQSLTTPPGPPASD
jgi:ribonuclease-3